MIWIGTSGFQYPEWKGSFYPATLSTAKMLPFYAGHFPTTEINYSFRRIPSIKTLTNWSALTPAKFHFSLKAPQEITHIRKLRDCCDVLGRFCEALASLRNKLGPILFQLPPFFKKDVPLLEEFLAALPSIRSTVPTESGAGEGFLNFESSPSAKGSDESTPATLECAFEFRHPSWFDDETFATLKSHNAALCIAESEELATPPVFTANFGYFRLRREDYEGKDILRWAKIIREQQARLADVYVYFKHEEAGVGPKFAKQLMAELSA